MATARKAAPDPLVEELPPQPEPNPPKSAEEVYFNVEIASYVINGEVRYRWTILEHNFYPFIGDYSAQTNGGFESCAAAEWDAAGYVARIREAIDLKIRKPKSYTIKL